MNPFRRKDDAVDADDTELLLAATTVLHPGGHYSPGWLRTRGDRIVAGGAGLPDGTPDHDFAGCVLAPGFVDMHVHGGGGGAYTSGDVGEVHAVADFHRRHGTTTTLASLVSAAPEELERSVSLLADLVDDGVLAGIHLEGPWLSASRGGAHDRGQLRPPDPGEVDQLLRLGRGAVRMVTLAPELDGAMAAIGRIVGAGAVAAIGHTDASYDTTREAIAAGARVGTHLFNGMRPLHHREPGPVMALLEDPAVTVEVVADGVHLHPRLVSWVRHVAGADRVALVTDAMAAAGMPDGDYQLGSLRVHVRDRVARLPGHHTPTDTPTGTPTDTIAGTIADTPTGTIAGSTATMDEMFRNAVVHSDLPRPDALVAASVMTAATPAAALGLGDVGSLEAGRRADLVVLDSDLRTVGVMRAGRWVAGVGGS